MYTIHTTHIHLYTICIPFIYIYIQLRYHIPLYFLHICHTTSAYIFENVYKIYTFIFNLYTCVYHFRPSIHHIYTSCSTLFFCIESSKIYKLLIIKRTRIEKHNLYISCALAKLSNIHERTNYNFKVSTSLNSQHGCKL